MDKANFTLDSKVVPVRVRYKSTVEYHESLVHMWKDWYQEYFEAEFPRLIVRLEDVVFHPEKVLKEVCNCVDGSLSKTLTLTGESAKAGDEKFHGKNLTNLADAMVSHVFTNRTKGMTRDDHTYAIEALEDSVMKTFGYTNPTLDSV